ncbi:hypothetical protein [Streptomyces sp. NBC_00687]|uniref:hypothetical protein n=1 Tax=Streptomyces sp. NBC_00687 TaxID=2975807 RepID=UPI0022545AF4|nr:hypothetical protein [Streptomyces sp. NBC_00687]MCX4912790.1 hypothetical protein [Streptomyces sp. NBC_00687]
MTESTEPKKRGRPATEHDAPASVRPKVKGLTAAFDAAAKAARSNRSQVTEELWAWFARVPGATLPPRPDRQPGAEAVNKPKRPTT